MYIIVPSDDFLTYTLTCASKFVEERVDEELKGSAHKVAIEYLNVVLKSDLGPFNGTLFEKVVHRTFIDEKCVPIHKSKSARRFGK